MDKAELFKFYEKMYFHELEQKDKIVARIQINFAIIATVITVIAYMARTLDLGSNCVALTLFITLLSAAFLFLALSIKSLVKAFHGNLYQCIATSTQWEKYHSDLKDYYDSVIKFNQENPESATEVPDIQEMLKDGLHKEICDATTRNTDVNEKRAGHIHNSVKWLLVMGIPFFIASFIFIAFDLDVSSPRKETPIIDKSQSIQLKAINSTLLELAKINKDFIKMTSNIRKGSFPKSPETTEPPAQPAMPKPVKPSPPSPREVPINRPLER